MEPEPDTKVVARDEVPEPAEAKVAAPEDNRRQSSSSASDAVLRVVGRYELIHRLGHGGMASVHLGRATGKGGFEKLAAIKVIHEHLASEPEFVEMFLDEARIAARIHHPHVVEILDLGDDDGVFYMVMEYVEGATLSALIRELVKADEYLPLPVVLQIVSDACEGLAAAHELCDQNREPYKLVHRDVSPQNLLVGLDGWVKVVDFGIMKAAGKRSNTLTGQLRGKVAYMAPEQALGRELDLRTDLFALGVVLWELCTNQRLFDGKTEVAVLEQVTRCEVPTLLDVRPELPIALQNILARALSREPGDRYASAEAMLSDLRQLIRETSADTYPRRFLAERMRHYFSAKVDYVRAALRDTPSGTGRRRNGELSAHPSASEKTAALGAGPGTAAASSNVGVVPGTGTHTLTGSLAQAPARHWSLWLVLPLVGAAIGTAVMSWDGSREQAQAAQIAAPADVAPSQAPNVVVPDEPQHIKWVFNTDPQGATVTIDGDRKDGVTPLEVVVGRGEDLLKVVFEKEGFVPRRVWLAPLRTDHHNYALNPAAQPEPAVEKQPKVRFRAKTRGQKRGTKPKQSSPTPDAESKRGQDERTLKEPAFPIAGSGKTSGK